MTCRTLAQGNFEEFVDLRRRSALRTATGSAARHPTRRARNPFRRRQHHRVDVSGAWARASTGRRDPPPPAIETLSAPRVSAQHRRSER